MKILWDTYERLGKAYATGKGCRLSADEVYALVRLDEAIAEAIRNAFDVCELSEIRPYAKSVRNSGENSEG